MKSKTQEKIKFELNILEFKLKDLLLYDFYIGFTWQWDINLLIMSLSKIQYIKIKPIVMFIILIHMLHMKNHILKIIMFY